MEKEDLVFVFKKLNMKPFNFIRKGDSKVKKELIGINEKDDDNEDTDGDHDDKAIYL